MLRVRERRAGEREPELVLYTVQYQLDQKSAEEGARAYGGAVGAAVDRDKGTQSQSAFASRQGSALSVAAPRLPRESTLPASVGCVLRWMTPSRAESGGQCRLVARSRRSWPYELVRLSIRCGATEVLDIPARD